MADIKEMLKQIRERVTPEQSRFVDDNMAIVDYIYDLLDEKNMKSSDLAKAMGKTPAEISKWLSGTHNLTLLSLTKIAVALNETIIMTPAQAKEKYEKIQYMPLAVTAKVNKQNELISNLFKDEETFGPGCGNFIIYTTQNERNEKPYSN